jgi:hypothetical protein
MGVKRFFQVEQQAVAHPANIGAVEDVIPVKRLRFLCRVGFYPVLHPFQVNQMFKNVGIVFGGDQQLQQVQKITRDLFDHIPIYFIRFVDVPDYVYFGIVQGTGG